MKRRARELLLGLGCALGASAPAAQPGSHPRIPLWDAPAIEAACGLDLEKARMQVAALAKTPLDRATVEGVFRPWDRPQILLEDTQGPVDILTNLSPDAKARAAGEACLLKMNEFNTELFQNEKIYELIRRTVPADGIDRKLKKDAVEAFEDTGVALPAEKRARMKAILQRLEEIRQAFDRDIRDNNTRLGFSPAEMKGLPASYLEKARRDDKGNYLLGFEYPEYEPFMANAESEDARRRYYIAFNDRGTPRNLDLLAESARLRHEIAVLYRLPSYAHFVTRRRMVGNPETVHRFLDQVKDRVRDLELREMAELRALKAGRLGRKPDEVTLDRWDIAYYQEQLRKTRYDVDEEALRAYFPTEASIAWVLAMSSELYGIKFVRAEAPVWHPAVRYYDVIDAATGGFLGGIYLDLFPREGKYSHAAAFGVRSVSLLAGRTPISVLVTNFNRDGLDHGEIETFLHEFGHVLHGVLSRTRYASEGGTNVERDFVEAPSQMYEEWGRRLGPLRLLHRYCTACPEIDEALVKRLHAARSFGRGIRYGRQHLYASYDMALFGEREVDPMQTWIRMESGTPAGYVPGTQFPGTFGHLLGGYGAGYYGYMWSEVIALDMLSRYGKNLMNPAVGRRFRELILARGGEEPAAQMVREFLGRDPSPEAFFEEITGRREN
ncbi:MAG TPA: M3 family metallopeptidase [Burkholderiales bacterium]|nr:M3 family metallopeptidase [Burkholderiales bacterium]